MTYVAQGSRTVVRDDIVFGSVSHVGMERTENQDFCGYYEPDDDRTLELKGRLFVVCDGMGGHAGGEIASRMGVEKIVEAYYNDPGSNTIEAIKRSIEMSSRSVWDKAQDQPALRGMGSTSVVMVLKNNMAYFGHVGDSRAYIIRQGKIEQITKDHSLVQQMVDEGLLDASEMENHPDKNVILRSMGVKPEVEVDILYHPVETGDIYLLCTDGLSGLVSDEEILNITLANEANPQEGCQRLVDLANAYGGYDNTTVQIIKINQVQAGPPPSDMTTGVFTADQVQESIDRARAEMGMPPAAPGAAAPPPGAPPPPSTPKTQPSMAAPNIASAPRSKPAPAAAGGGGGGGGKVGMLMALVFLVLFLIMLMSFFTVQTGVNDYRAAVDKQIAFYKTSGGITDAPDELSAADQAIDDGVSTLRGMLPFGAGSSFEAAADKFESLESSQKTMVTKAFADVSASLPLAKDMAVRLGAEESDDFKAGVADEKAAESATDLAQITLMRSAEAAFRKAASDAAREKCSELEERNEDHIRAINSGGIGQQLQSVVEAARTEANEARRLKDAQQYVAAYWSLVRVEKILGKLAGN